MKKFAGTITDIRIKSVRLKGDALQELIARNSDAMLDDYGLKYFTGWVSGSPNPKFEGKKIKSAVITEIDYLYGFVETRSKIYKVGDHPDIKLLDGDILIIV